MDSTYGWVRVVALLLELIASACSGAAAPNGPQAAGQDGGKTYCVGTYTGAIVLELMAANLVTIIPVILVYFFAQDKLIGGIASVGLKG